MKTKEEVLEIKINQSHFEGQTDRLISECNLSKEEAEIISMNIRNLIEMKLNEQDQNWSESTKEAFTNIMIAILIEEAKILGRKKNE